MTIPEEKNERRVKIVVLDGQTLNPGDLSWKALEAYGEVQVYERTPQSLINERLKDVQIVLTNKTPITEQVFSENPGIKMVAVLATGYNVVDIEAAKRRGIAVCNVPTYGTDAVAQFVFALLLALSHRVELHNHSVKAGEWTKHTDFCYWKTPMFELANKTIGLVGFGRIGLKTAEIALAFGMKVLAFDTNPKNDFESHPTLKNAMDVGSLQRVTLDLLLDQSDVVSLHVPLFESTKHIINSESLSKMKRGAYLINTSRGPLIDEVALCSALQNGHLAGAALDVVSVEPIEATNPLLDAPNLILTPHIAWAPIEARARLMATVVDNVAAFLAGKPINCVNL